MADAAADKVLNLNGKEYEIDSLSDEAKNILGKISLVSGDKQRINFELEIISFSEAGYINALQQVIDKNEQEKAQSDNEGEDSGQAEADNG